MVKNLLVLAAFAAATYQTASAQSLSLSNVQRSVWGSAESGTIITSEATVTNTSGVAFDVRVSSQEISVQPSTLNYFCWGQCFEPGVTTSPQVINLGPGQSISDMFYGDYKPEGVMGVSTIRYCFYNDHDITDSTCYTATFTAFGVGIEDNPLLTRGMGDPYPNPAVNSANIKYAFNSVSNAKLQVYDMLGQHIRTISIDKPEGAVKLDLNGFRPGVYLLRMENGGKAVATRRLNVVR